MNTWQLYTVTNAAAIGAMALTNALGYRPSFWPAGNVAQLVYLRTNIAGYFFDAVLREEHDTALRITDHPVQTGANISDHAYQLPEHLILEIGMSDAMASFIGNQYSGSGGKSVSCYQKLKELQYSRVPLTVMTRINIYRNMIIEHISAPQDFKTATGLRAIVALKQIITATISTTTVKSDRSQTTDSTSKGTVQSSQVDDSSILSRGETAMFGGTAQ